MSSSNFHFSMKFFSVLIFLISLACSPNDSPEEEEEPGEPYMTAEIGGVAWVADTITRSGISVREDGQSYGLFGNDENFGVYITISDSPYVNRGVLREGNYTGTEIFFEFAHLYGQYAIPAYFQGDRSTSDNVIEIIHSDGNTISGNFSGTFFKGERNYPPLIDENSPEQISITNGEFRNMPLDHHSTFPN